MRVSKGQGIGIYTFTCTRFSEVSGVMRFKEGIVGLDIGDELSDDEFHGDSH